MDDPLRCDMLKLIAFDLDNTLAPLGEPIPHEDIILLRKLMDAGVRVAVASGKPTYYLCGLMRQAGLPDAILIGENGAAIEFGVSLPPSRSVTLPYSDAARESIQFIRRGLEERLPHLWYQPNRVALTPFPTNEHEFHVIEQFLHENSSAISDIDVYRHCDSFDIVPHGIDKKSGLSYLCDILGVTAEETAAVGDGVNDYPMFDFVSLPLGINVTDESRVSRNFRTSTEALRYILTLI